MVPGMINAKQVFLYCDFLKLRDFGTGDSLFHHPDKVSVWMSCLINTPSVNFMLVMVKHLAKHFVDCLFKS